MGKDLIIVESPAKTKTLKSFLGPGYRVEASMGHVRDLPAKTMGVDVEHDFKPRYVPIPERKEILKKLAAAAKEASTVYLASDPDREGEAIAWHLMQALKLKNARRIEFNEITRQAVEGALAHPRDVDLRRVDAQEARRVLDRLVGYRISPLLWKKVRTNLSAGRVQSVAVRLICDREREIQSFVPEEYWTITAQLTPQPPEPRFPFEARLVARGEEKVKITTEAEAQEIVAALEGAAYRVASVRRREQRRNPAPPFITSTLQQEAARKLGFSNKRTMTVAQQLYEGIELGEEGAVGLITYMRTDSTRVAAEAQTQAREFIIQQFGEAYVPPSPRQYAAKRTAQDAHEAIRPTSVLRTPDLMASFLSQDQLRLYRLIWTRFLASQMAAALYSITTADIEANGFVFRATGSVVVFDGFTRIYTEGKDSDEQADEERPPLPQLAKGQDLELIGLLPRQHFTEPPPRYTEATLVKALEEKGIGRPSTYASIIATIQDRGYVKLEAKRFYPTELGIMVNDLLVKHFPDILDVGFTAEMENKLDAVEEGRADKVQLLREFYGPFDASVEQADATMERVKPQPQETDIQCPSCGRKMLLREGRYGKFLGCSGYPKCKTVLNVDGSARDGNSPDGDLTDQQCPKCGKPMVVRTSKFGKFLGCSGYPKCKTTLPMPGAPGEGASSDGSGEHVSVRCPKCGSDLIRRKTRYGNLYVCSNETACDYKTWSELNGDLCPICGWPVGMVKFRGRPTGTVRCTNPACDYSVKAPQPEAVATPSE
ncbi:MAG: type I DNA topoisomerase [Chthonomonadales bacterium]